MTKFNINIVTKENPHYDQAIKDGDKKFSWSKSHKETIKGLFNKYPQKQSAILPLLHLAQDEFIGWLPKNLLQLVADTLDIELIKVYEVASFHNMFNLKPVGKHHVKVCTNCACMLVGSDEVLQTVEKEIGETVNGISLDGNFTVTEVECLGDCTNAPVMLINKEHHNKLTPTKTKEILQNLKKS